MSAVSEVLFAAAIGGCAAQSRSPAPYQNVVTLSSHEPIECRTRPRTITTTMPASISSVWNRARASTMIHPMPALAMLISATTAISSPKAIPSLIPTMIEGRAQGNRIFQKIRGSVIPNPRPTSV